MSSFSSRLTGFSLKRVLGVVGLCLFVMIASVLGSYYVMRVFLSTNAIYPAPFLALSTNADLGQDLRLATLERKASEAASELTYLKNSRQDQDYIQETALHELLQARLFEKYTKRSGNSLHVTPFAGNSFLRSIAFPTQIWDAYPIRGFRWSNALRWSSASGEYPWTLSLTKGSSPSFAIALDILSDASINSGSHEPAPCDEKIYHIRVRQLASYFHTIYPEDDIAQICANIEVSAPLKGGDLMETDPKTKKQVPVVVRAYIYRPKDLSTVEIGESVSAYRLGQPLATAVVMREAKDPDYWYPAVFQWVVTAPPYSRDDGYLTEQAMKVARVDVDAMLKTFARESLLRSGFCGYEDCY